MNKHKQKGSASIVIIILLVLVILIGAGYIVYNRSSSTDNDSKTDSQQISVSDKDYADDKEAAKAQLDYSIRIIGEVTDLNKKMYIVPADLDSLPNDIPVGLRESLSKKLANKQEDSMGCAVAYMFYKYNDVNAYGAVGSVDKTTGKYSDTCGGGSASYWYVMQDGTWEVFNTQQGIGCSQLATVKIYSEFLAQCMSDEKNWDVPIANTNGPSSALK